MGAVGNWRAPNDKAAETGGKHGENEIPCWWRFPLGTCQVPAKSMFAGTAAKRVFLCYGPDSSSGIEQRRYSRFKSDQVH